MVGEVSDTELEGCAVTSEIDSEETTVDGSSEGMLEEGNAEGSGGVVSEGVIELSGMEGNTEVPGFVSDGVTELSCKEGKTVGSKVGSLGVTELPGVEGSAVSLPGSGDSELSGAVGTGS